MLRRVWMLMTVGVVGLLTPPAFASEQFLTAYDAKSVGMGLTGTAWQNNASAPYFNAANLGAIKRFDAVLAIGPNVSRVRSPYFSNLKPPGGAVQGHSAPLLSPLLMAGVAFKPHKVIAVGLTSGVSQVSGVHFKDVPASLLDPRNKTAAVGDSTSFGLVWDARLAIALNLTKWLSVGGGYRIGFTHQQQEFAINDVKVQKAYLHGQRYTGGFAGLTVKPHRLVRIGLSYTSPFNITSEGTITSRTSTGIVSIPGAQIPVLMPAQANAGIAIQTANNRLTIAADYKFFFYKDAVHQLAAADTESRQANQNAMSGHLGAELYVTPRVPLRAGFMVGRSRTTDASAFATRFPPGIVLGGTLGAGVKLPHVDLDLGVGYGGSHKTLPQGAAALQGTYGLEAWIVQASANVHI